MSKAHLKRGASSTGEKRQAKAPSFKAIFDCRREKGLGMSSNLKASKKHFAKFCSYKLH
jgi:hypothetical protein